jgi:hypothetical protein
LAVELHDGGRLALLPAAPHHSHEARRLDLVLLRSARCSSAFEKKVTPVE